MAEGSMPGRRVFRIVFRAWAISSEVVGVLAVDGEVGVGIFGERWVISVSIVCKGSSGCQLSIHSADAWKPPFMFIVATGVRLCKLVMLFVLDRRGAPTGIFPRAFSDMPRSCSGTVSSIDDIDAALELFIDCADACT